MDDFLPKECDIVMEGGVTSGVVYPAFVARLAQRFTLRSIGGTSVGAVAAIAAAAAQFKRNRVRKTGQGSDDGFVVRTASGDVDADAVVGLPVQRAGDQDLSVCHPLVLGVPLSLGRLGQHRLRLDGRSRLRGLGRRLRGDCRRGL